MALVWVCSSRRLLFEGVLRVNSRDDLPAGLLDEFSPVCQDVEPSLVSQLLQVFLNVLFAEVSLQLSSGGVAFSFPAGVVFEAFSAVVEPDHFEIGERGVGAQVEFAGGPFCAFDFAGIEEAAVVDGDEVHAFHVADRHDRPDHLVDAQDFPRVVRPLVQRGQGGQLVPRRVPEGSAGRSHRLLYEFVSASTNEADTAKSINNAFALPHKGELLPRLLLRGYH